MLRRQEDPSLSSVAIAKEAKCMCWKLEAQEKHTALPCALGRRLPLYNEAKKRLMIISPF